MEVVSWHIFIAIFTPPTKSIFRTTLITNVVANIALSAVGDVDKGSLAERGE